MHQEKDELHHAIPCLLTIDKDGMHLYDIRKDHPHSLILNINLDIQNNGIQSGFAMLTMYNHLNDNWRRKLVRIFARQRDHRQISKPSAYKEKWKKEKRKRKSLFD